MNTVINSNIIYQALIFNTAYIAVATSAVYVHASHANQRPQQASL